MKQIIATVLLTAGLALGPTLASAGETVSQSVRVSDLDLASVDGQRTLMQRLDRAIEEVCTAASTGETSKLRRRDVMDDCRGQARTSVQVQLAQRGLDFHQVASRR